MKISVDQVSVKYRKNVGLKPISYTFEENMIYSIFGSNSSGKTSLLKVISGLQSTYEGSVKADENILVKGIMHPEITYISGGMNHFNIKVKELLNRIESIYENLDSDFVENMIEAFAINKEQRINELSKGAKSALNIVIGLASHTEVLILDDPTEGCDIVVRERFNEYLIEAFKRYPRTIIIASHMVSDVEKIANEVIIMDEQSIVQSFSMDEYQDKAFTVTGLIEDVQKAVNTLQVIGMEVQGKYAIATVFDERSDSSANVSFENVDLHEYVAAIIRKEDYSE